MEPWSDHRTQSSQKNGKTNKEVKKRRRARGSRTPENMRLHPCAQGELEPTNRTEQLEGIHFEMISVAKERVDLGDGSARDKAGRGKSRVRVDEGGSWRQVREGDRSMTFDSGSSMFSDQG